MALLPKPYPKFHGGGPVALPAPVVIVEITAWQTIGGILTNPAYYTPDVTALLGRAVGLICSIGTGAELRITEIDPDDSSESNLISSWAAPDTANAWQPYAFTTTTPPRGGNKNYIYELRARLNGATSMSLKYCSLALLEL